MRAFWALLACAGLATAGDEGVEGAEAEVHALVEELGAPRLEARRRAFARLAEMGEAARPVLECVRSPDPEVRRAVAALLRRGRPVRLSAWIAPREGGGELPREFRVGEALLVLVTLHNHCGFRVHGAVGGADGDFVVIVEAEDGETAVHPLPPALVEPGELDVLAVPREGLFFALAPSETAVFRLRMEAGDSPLRRPGTFRVSVTANLDLKYARAGADAGELPSRLRSNRVEVHVAGRSADELRAAMQGTAAERKEAIAELLNREDEEALPLLREHAHNEGLRLAALRRLGAVAHPQDLDLILEVATGRAEHIEARRAAAAALARYPDDRARTALLRLTSDERLRQVAVRSLASHKHPQTVSCYISLLKRTYRSGPWVQDIERTLYDWTHRVVKADHASEVDALERWWRENRRAWTKEHCPQR